MTPLMVFSLHMVINNFGLIQHHKSGVNTLSVPLYLSSISQLLSHPILLWIFPVKIKKKQVRHFNLCSCHRQCPLLSVHAYWINLNIKYSIILENPRGVCKLRENYNRQIKMCRQPFPII